MTRCPASGHSSLATVAVLVGGYALAFFYAPEDERGLHPEDLLPARAAGDRGAARLHGRRDPRDPPPAHGRARARRPLLRLDPHLGDLRRRRAAHRGDLGQGPVGRLVGVARADPGQLPDRLPALRHLLPAALLDRGPRPPGALRLGLRDHRGRVRAAQLPRGPARRALHPPAHLLLGRRPARRDAARLPASASPGWRCCGRPWSASSWRRRAPPATSAPAARLRPSEPAPQPPRRSVARGLAPPAAPR